MSSSESDHEDATRAVVQDKDVEEEDTNAALTFADLGLHPDLVEACDKMGWKKPTPIQREAIPVALSGRDVIGLAETGSGKTGAFALPILHALLSSPQRLFALVLTPTRELAYQISEQFDKLGRDIRLKTAVLVGEIELLARAFLKFVIPIFLSLQVVWT